MSTIKDLEKDNSIVYKYISGSYSQNLSIPCPSIEPSAIYENEVVSIKVNGLEYNKTWDTYVVKMNIQNIHFGCTFFLWSGIID